MSQYLSKISSSKIKEVVEKNSHHTRLSDFVNNCLVDLQLDKIVFFWSHLYLQNLTSILHKKEYPPEVSFRVEKKLLSTWKTCKYTFIEHIISLIPSDYEERVKTFNEEKRRSRRKKYLLNNFNWLVKTNGTGHLFGKFLNGDYYKSEEEDLQLLEELNIKINSYITTKA